MRLEKTLDFISHLKWIFLLVSIILIFYSFIVLPENLISVIGIIVFLMGIQMGLESLSDQEKMSEKEKLFFANEKYVRRQSIIILASISILALISIMFISLKFIFASANKFLFNELFNLGLDCWALILGLLCILKSIRDKHNYVLKNSG